MVGSTNLDALSLNKLGEGSLVMANPEMARAYDHRFALYPEAHAFHIGWLDAEEDRPVDAAEGLAEVRDPARVEVARLAVGGELIGGGGDRDAGDVQRVHDAHESRSHFTASMRLISCTYGAPYLSRTGCVAL